MAVINLSGILISYPTAEDGANTSEPIISHASSDQHAVTIALVTNNEPFSLKAVIQRYTDGERTQIILTSKQAHFIDEQTREREIVGIMQWHYARTVLDWIEAGELEPFRGAVLTEEQVSKRA